MVRNKVTRVKSEVVTLLCINDEEKSGVIDSCYAFRIILNSVLGQKPIFFFHLTITKSSHSKPMLESHWLINYPVEG